MKKLLRISTLLILSSVLTITAVNAVVVFSVKNRVINRETAAEIKNVDYVVVLGCGINGNRPTHMLEDRLLEGMAIASENEDCILMLTGDNSGEDYNEVGVMKNYCIEAGFDESRIMTDDFGFSTGESMENMKNNFSAEKIIVITQDFHVYRALFIAEKIGLDAYAVASSPRKYSTWIYNSTREPLARVKDFIKYSF